MEHYAARRQGPLDGQYFCGILDKEIHEGVFISISKIAFLMQAFIFSALHASPIVVTKIVGKVGDYSLTSREVIGGLLLENALNPELKVNVVENVSSPEFVTQVTTALIEKVVALEAENF